MLQSIGQPPPCGTLPGSGGKQIMMRAIISATVAMLIGVAALALAHPGSTAASTRSQASVPAPATQSAALAPIAAR